MNHKQMKLENPIRLKELNPVETLKRIGLQENHVLSDIGAGSGIFTIPAARLSKNKIYALEMSDDMLSIIGEKASQEGLENIELIKVNSDKFDLIDDTIDMALLVTVLHEIDKTKVFLEEIKRILKDKGTLAVIEFHKRETPMGPTMDHRIGKEDVIDRLEKAGFMVMEDFDLGDNLYCITFQSVQLSSSRTE